MQPACPNACPSQIPYRSVGTWAPIGFVGAVQFESNIVLATAALVVASIGAVSAAPLFWPIPTAFLGGRFSGGWNWARNGARQLGRIFSFYVIGWLKDVSHSGHSGMYALTGFLLLDALIAQLTPAKLLEK